MLKARVCPTSFGTTFAAILALIYCLREFPLSSIANRFEFRCQLKQLLLLYYSGTSINGHLCTTDTSEQRINIFVPNTVKQRMTPPYSGHLPTTDIKIGPKDVWCTSNFKSKVVQLIVLLKVPCALHQINAAKWRKHSTSQLHCCHVRTQIQDLLCTRSVIAVQDIAQ